MSDVLIYNAGGTEVLARVPMRHAITMLHRRVAHVLEAVDGQRVGPYPRPRSVELVRYVFTRWKYQRTGRVQLSRSAVLLRDRYRCAYCPRPGTTLDHVVPRCQGGQTTWLNSVAACEDCNGRKKGRTPEQAGMRLLFEPYVPTLEDLYPRRSRAR